MTNDVLVITGAGGIGQAIARRQGPGKHVLLADISEENLASAAAALEDLGHAVSTQRVDVSSRDSVRALAEAAAELGAVVQVVHTAGVSPVQASAATVLAVDLLGTALVLEEFGRVIAPGGAGIVISSMAGHMFPPFDSEQERALAHTPTDELLALPFLDPDSMGRLGLRLRQARQPPPRPGGEPQVGAARRARQRHQPWDHHHAAGPRRDVRPWRGDVPEDDRDLRHRTRRHT